MYRHFLYYPYPQAFDQEDTVLHRAFHKVLLLKVQEILPEVQLIEELSTPTRICLQTGEEVNIDEHQLQPTFSTCEWNKKMSEWVKGE